MNITDFISLRSQKFSDHLRSKGVDLPEKFSFGSIVRSLGPNLLALDGSTDESPEVNEKEMSATFIISTPNADRMGDVVSPKGCLKHLDSYRRNPQVFFSHRSNEFPVGSARKNAASPTEIEVGDKIVAKSYFHCLTAESELVFKLVKLGILRCASIGFIPHVAALINDREDEEKDEKNALGEDLIYFGDNRAKFFPALRFHEWELTEFSIVPIPMNPFCESLSMHLSRGHIEGQVIPGDFRKALEPYALPRTIWSPGALLTQVHLGDPSPCEKMGVEKHYKKVCSCGKIIEQCRCTSNTKTTEVVTSGCSDCKKEKSMLPDETPKSPPPSPGDNKPGVSPYEGWSHGAKFLDSLSKKVNELKGYMDQECSMLDQPRLKKYSEKKSTRLQKDLFKLQKLGATLYPEKFQDPGEYPEGDKSIGVLPVEEKVAPVETPVIPVEEKKVEVEQKQAPTAPELPIEEIEKLLASILQQQEKIEDKFYGITGK